MNRAGPSGRFIAAVRAWTLVNAPALWIRCARPDDRELGLLGEELAARHLVRSGWRILGRRVRTPAAEIDLLARDGRELVCVEVKTARRRQVVSLRGGSAEGDATDLRWRPGARCDARQLARLVRAGRFVAHGGARSEGRAAGARVDLIEVWVEEGRGRWELVHHRDLRRPIA